MKIKALLLLLSFIVVYSFSHIKHQNTRYELLLDENKMNKAYLEEVYNEKKQLIEDYENLLINERRHFDYERIQLNQANDTLRSELIDNTSKSYFIYDQNIFVLNLVEIDEIHTSLELVIDHNKVKANSQLEKINPIVLYDLDDHLFLLVNYDTANKYASYMFVQYNKSTQSVISHFALSYNSIFDTHSLSHDASKIAMVFSRYELTKTDYNKYSQLVLVDLHGVRLVDFHALFEAYEVRIDQVLWLSHDHIQLIDTSDKIEPLNYQILLSQ